MKYLPLMAFATMIAPDAGLGQTEAQTIDLFASGVEYAPAFDFNAGIDQSAIYGSAPTFSDLLAQFPELSAAESNDATAWQFNNTTGYLFAPETGPLIIQNTSEGVRAIRWCDICFCCETSAVR